MADPQTPSPRLTRGPHLPALERLAPSPTPGRMAREIEARTSAGDVVLELQGQGGWVARAAIDRLRRAFAIETTALTRLVAEIVLRPPDLRHLDAAVSGIAADSRGTEGGLRHRIDALYASHCATCGGGVVLDELIWDAEATDPSRKAYRCPRCRDGRADGRPVPVEPEDLYLARSVDADAARALIKARFPAPRPDHPLPEDLVGLYPARALVALGALLERIETELRAPSIQAALRLALVHMVLPVSRLNGYPGRISQLRIANGRVKPPGSRQWRERNAWSAFEEGCRVVREFVTELAEQGPLTPARVGPDLKALVDGAANVALRFGTPVGSETFGPPPRSDDDPGPRPRVRPGIRLVLTQPPVHWSADNLAFAYVASAIAVGPEGASTLPLEMLFGAPPRGEWSRDAAVLRRSLTAVRPVLLPDARVVIVLEGASPETLVASVIGGVGAGYQVDDAALVATGEGVSGAVELLLPRPGSSGAREATLRSATDPAAPFQVAFVEAAVADIAVAVIQLRGEPTRFDRILSEVLVGLDHLGHLRRLVGARADAAPPTDEIDAAADAPPRPRASGLFGEPPPASASPVDAPRRTTAGRRRAGGSTTTSEWGDGGSASDPVRTTLDIIRTEMRRADHPRLLELREDLWWIRDPRDLAAAKPALSERVEWSVFSLLTTSGPLSETSFRERIGRLFRGPETADAELVRACLAAYRSRAPSSSELIHTDESLQGNYRDHGEVVGLLTEVGHRMGMRAWIARREQRRRYDDGTLADLLSEPEQRVYLPLVAPGPPEALERIDCIWYVRGRGAFLFDVEWLAALEEPVLVRGPSIDTTESLVRFLVIPDERTELVRLRIARSPVLERHLRADNWHILKWSHVRRLHASGRTDLAALSPLVGLDPAIEQGEDQMAMFAS
jgi:hypothetical protein